MDDKELDKIKKELIKDFNRAKKIQSNAVDSYDWHDSQENQDSLILSISSKATVVSALMAIEGEQRKREESLPRILNKAKVKVLK